MRTRSKAAMFVNSDFSDLLRLFSANQVKLAVASVHKSALDLEALLAHVTEANRHGETSTGTAVGREAW
jgi:hypothetical protein